MGKISVIIPLYKGHDTLKQTLYSIAMQSIIDETEIVIVNDCDGINYADILAKFDDLNIKYVTNPRNLGCGGARNTGIREASNSIICFIDSDDQFISSLTLEIMYNRIKAEGADMLAGAFESEMRQDNGIAIKKMERSVVWCHNKFYRRQFLLDNNLFFNENLRICEDTEFHQLLIDMGGKVAYTPFCGYMWRDNQKSVTHESLYKNKWWFVKAITEYLRDCKKRGLGGEKVVHRTLQNLVVAYEYYNIVLDDTPENKDDYLAVCREYWKLADEITAGVSDEEITRVFLPIMRQQCSLIPSVTFMEFLDEIKS